MVKINLSTKNILVKALIWTIALERTLDLVYNDSQVINFRRQNEKNSIYGIGFYDVEHCF
jgi:hypothetical protein